MKKPTSITCLFLDIGGVLPPDANCLLSAMDHCLRSRHYVNVVIAGKHPAPQWLTIHVRGYKEEGTITTPFDMTVLNELDRFHLVMDTIDRLPQTGDKGIYLKQQIKDKLIEHKQYIDKNGEDLPEIRNWKWSNTK